MTSEKNLLLLANIKGLEQATITLEAMKMLNQSIGSRDYTAVIDPEGLEHSPTLIDIRTGNRYEGLSAIREHIQIRDNAIKYSL